MENLNNNNNNNSKQEPNTLKKSEVATIDDKKSKSYAPNAQPLPRSANNAAG